MIEAAAQLETEGRWDEAEQLCRQILKTHPRDFHALHRLACVLSKRRQWFEALYRFEEAFRINPNSAMTVCNIGMVIAEIGDHARAAKYLGRAVHMAPDNPIALSNWSNELEKSGQIREAREVFDRILALKDQDTQTDFHKAVALLRLGKHRDALPILESVTQRDPDAAQPRYTLGTTLLALGDYKRGFAECEYRLKVGDHVLNPAITAQRWHGERLVGKSILIYAEQGIGDSIQFMRFVPAILKLEPRKIHLIVHSAVKRLAVAAFPAIGVRDEHDEIPSCDYQCPLFSLVHELGTTIETIPPPLRYRAPVAHDGYRIGVCWHGNASNKNDHHRSIPFETFERLLHVPRVTYFDLHEEHGYKDMAETAQTIAAMDLVISVDTAVVHLAGSIGVPTWALLPKYQVDWRWGLSGETSPWYPGMRLIRQREAYDWAFVIDRIAVELNAQQKAAA